jgi:hypothetical protein
MNAFLVKVWGWFLYVPRAIATEARAYPKVSNVALLAWTAFSTSWSTNVGIPFNLSGLGIPLSFTINARLWVTTFQAHAHLPTWAVTIVTALVWGLVAFGNWEAHKAPAA